MSSYDDPTTDGNTRAVTRRVQDTLTEMHQIRRQFQEARQIGSVDEGIHLRFQSSLVASYEELRPFRNRAKEQWDDATLFEKGLDALPAAVRARPERCEKSSGMGRQRIVVEDRPSFISEWHLLQISYDIDDIAREIGFEPSPSKDLPDVAGGRI